MKLLRNLLFVSCVCFLTNSCVKKIVEEATNDLFVSIMTTGKWKVTSYMEETTDLTASFMGWETQFFSNNTSISIKGTSTVNGTWSGGLATNKMTVNTVSPIAPLEKLIGTWDIVNGTFTTAKFSQYRNGVNLKLELTKL